MDNLTHTLVGLVIGESAARATAHDPLGLSQSTRRNLFVSLMAIGSNLPDLDAFPSRLVDSKLDYLLHHRGHTHTLIGALALGVLLYALFAAWCRWRTLRISPRDHLQLVGIGLLASLLHIALDFTNSYGVHPFWPFDNRWYYGDSVFIVEPLYWAASAPLVFLLRSMLARGFVALALLGGIAASITTGMVPIFLCVLLAVLTTAMLAVGRFATPAVALGAALGICALINVVFSAASVVAARRIETIATDSFPDDQLLDHVLTPLPVNPLCWQAILVQSRGDEWSVRRAALSLAPNSIPASQCPSRGAPGETTAPARASGRASSDVIAWGLEITMQRDDLRRVVANDCDASAFLDFARAPWLAEREGQWILGDARYDNERELSFAEIELRDNTRDCRRRWVRWTPPRRDLLSATE